MSNRPKPFVPAWLNSAGLSQADFRVYCCLAARADIRTGVAWPKAETIAADCVMARRTVWKSLASLEDKKLIRKNGKRFADSNRYQVLVPFDANEAPKADTPIDANEAPKADTPIDANEAPPIGSPFAPPIDANEAPGTVTNKVNQRKKTNREAFTPSSEDLEFAGWFRSLLPESVNLRANWKESFAKVHNELVRLDRRNPQQIRAVCSWARADSFWRKNFMSPAKLRERKDGIQYFDLFAEKMKPAGPPAPPPPKKRVFIDDPPPQQPARRKFDP